MLLGSGPTLLAVGLAAELHGTRWVAGSALAFAAGSLLAPLSVARLERRALPPAVAWPALGVGMVAGWAFAAWRPAALLAAQFLSGMCMSALEGDMDARVAVGNPSSQGATASLATAAALRAFRQRRRRRPGPPDHLRGRHQWPERGPGHPAPGHHGDHPGLAPESVEPAPNRPGRPPRLEVVPRLGFGACLLLGG